MEAVNINAVKGPSVKNDLNPKSKEPKSKDGEFTKVLKNTRNSEEGGVRVQKKASDDGEIEITPEEAAVHKKERKLRAGMDKLTEMLSTLSNGVPNSEELLKVLNSGDEVKIKELLAGLLSGTLFNNGQGNNNVLASGETALKINPKELDGLVSNLAKEIISNKDFKAQLINLVNNVVQNSPKDNFQELKLAIVNKLDEMLKGASSNENKTDTKLELSVKNNFDKLDSKKQTPDDLVKTESSAPLNSNVSETHSNSEKHREQNPFNKEDKLLKQLVSDESTKNSKDSVSDKIANVVTRFEVINSDKPTAVEGKVTINRNNFNMDFIKAVKFMDLNNLKELTVKVLPKDLGEIVIRLSLDNGVMKANITAANKETYNLLNSQLPAISNQLSEQNMRIQSFSLSLSNGDNFLFNGNSSGDGQGRQQGNSKSHFTGINDEDFSEEVNSIEESNLNILA